MRRNAVLLFSLLLVACQSAGPVDEDSRFHVLPIGSRLILNQDITIPAHTAGVHIQGGRIVNGKVLNQYHPHCRLEVHDVREVAQTVTADEFLVHRVQHVTPTVSLPGLIKTGRRYVGSSSSLLVYQTFLGLRSARQPQVRWLACMQWGDSSLGQHVTTSEIRQTLGKIITLQIPAARS